MLILSRVNDKEAVSCVEGVLFEGASQTEIVRILAALHVKLKNSDRY